MPTNKPRVLFLTTVDWYFVSHRLNLAMELHENGFEVHLACKKGSSIDDITSKGIVCHPINMDSRPADFLSNLFASAKILLLLLKINPLVVINVSLKPIFLSKLPLCFLRKTRSLNIVTGLGISFTNSHFKYKMISLLISSVLRLFKRKKDQFVFQNTDDMDLFLKLKITDQKNSFLIPGSGVLLPHSTAPLPTTPCFLFGSRLLKSKGIEEFIGAANILKPRYPRVKFIVAGRIQSLNSASISKSTLERSQEEKIIEWYGHLKSLDTIWNEVSVAVLPTYYREGVPKFLLESLAHGRPIITTKSPGCRELLASREVGFATKARSALNLADVMEKMIQSPQLIQQLGQNGREMVKESYSMNKINKAYLELIGTLR